MSVLTYNKEVYYVENIVDILKGYLKSYSILCILNDNETMTKREFPFTFFHTRPLLGVETSKSTTFTGVSTKTGLTGTRSSVSEEWSYSCTVVYASVKTCTYLQMCDSEEVTGKFFYTCVTETSDNHWYLN